MNIVENGFRRAKNGQKAQEMVKEMNEKNWTKKCKSNDGPKTDQKRTKNGPNCAQKSVRND